MVIRNKNEIMWIKKCLDMVMSQIDVNFEVIIVDNESNDESLKVISKFVKVKVLKITDYSPGKALNLGVKESFGKYVVFLSGHCVPANNLWLKNLRDSIKHNEIHGVVAAYGRQIPTVTSTSQARRELFNTFRLDPILQENDFFFHNANSIVIKSVLKNFPFDENLTNAEDRVWAKGIIEKGLKIFYSPSAVVFHRDGISHNHQVERISQGENIIFPLYSKYQIIESEKDMKPKIFFIIVSKDQREIQELLDIVRKYPNPKLILIVSPINTIRITNKIPRTMQKKDEKFQEIWIDRGNIPGVDQMSLPDLLRYIANKDVREVFDYDYCIFLSPYYTKRPKDLIWNLIYQMENNLLDICYTGKVVHPNLWKFTKDNQLIPLEDSFLLRDKRDKFYEVFFGLGLIMTIPTLLRGQLMSSNSGLVEIEDIDLVKDKIHDRYL